MILSLDPSSSVTGYCLGRDDGRVVEAGKLTAPTRAKDALARIRHMVCDVEAMATEHEPEAVLIETPAPQAPRLSNKGQATYGMAVGAVIHAADSVVGERNVHTYRADEWTRGISKKHRQRCVAHDVPGYNPRMDAGGDVADAVGLLWWWVRERKVRV